MKIAVVSLALCAAAAQATPLQYDFSYAALGGTLSGSLMGELQADNNTLLIASLLDFVKFNGVDGPSLPELGSATDLFNPGARGTPLTSLDGLLQDFGGCSDVICSDGFLLGGAAIIGSAVYASGAAFGQTLELYDASHWHISAANVVPEPGSLLLAGLAICGLMAASRRGARG